MSSFALPGYFRFSALVALGMALLFIDFLTKAYLYYNYPLMEVSDPTYPYGGIEIFKNFLGIEGSISLTTNRGAAWGVFSDFQPLLLGVRVLVILGMLIYLIFVNNNSSIEIPFVMIIAGALGNVADHFLYGSVIDFIHFKFWGYDFPVFNLADCFITLGVVSLFFLICFPKKRDSLKPT